MEIKKLTVTAAIIEKDGKFLITQRMHGDHNGDRWEFPGGTVDPDEDFRLCLERRS